MCKFKIKLKDFIKSFGVSRKLNLYLLNKSILRKFLHCNDIEKKQISFFSNFIEKGDLVFDVGANLGSRTKVFLNLGASVISYEPQPELADYLYSYLKTCNKSKIIKKGLSNKLGNVEMHISNAHVLSSMSTRWIEATRQSGRFRNYKWNESMIVEVTTLDEEIEKQGLPSFIKIDVEGYELEVLEGLTKTVKSISFEFTAEEIDITIKCIKRLSMINEYNFNFCLGEDFNYELDKWLKGKFFIDKFSCFVQKNKNSWGDIYATLN